MRNAIAGLLLLLPCFLAATPAAMAQQEVRMGVLGLFHPRELILEQESGQLLSVAAKTASNRLVLNGEPGRRQLIFRAVKDRVVVGSRAAESWTATARDGSSTAFQLTVPGKFRRAYWGQLTARWLWPP